MITGSYTFSMDKHTGPAWLAFFSSAAKPVIAGSKLISSFSLLALLTEIDPTTATFSLQVRFNELGAYEQFDVEVLPQILSLLNARFLNQYAYFSTVLQEV